VLVSSVDCRVHAHRPVGRADPIRAEQYQVDPVSRPFPDPSVPLVLAIAWALLGIAVSPR
jgi:hypothetical protein